MKRLFVAAAVLLCCLSANAQFTVGAGYSYRTVAEKLVADPIGEDAVSHGVYIEAGYDIAFNRRFSVLALAQFGDYVGSGNHFYTKVPLHGKYVFASDEKLKLFLYLGPEFYYKVAENTADSFDFSYHDLKYNRWNVNIGGGIGGDIRKHIRVKMGYDWDLLNNVKNDLNGNYHSHAKDFNVGVSYVF